MKNTIIALLIMTFGLVSCNQKSNEKAPGTKTATEDTTEVYACPMHPEITGKKGDTCSKCGMELTEKVK
jgi:nitrous oxide reductase accessory protein NosL